jgi:acetoin utilization protein AcuB
MDIMTTDVRTVAPGLDAEAAFQLMRTQRIHHLVVMEGPKVRGVLSERDVGGQGGGALRRGHVVEDLMSTPAVAAAPQTTVREAANTLRARTIGCLPVVDRGCVVGIVTVSDLLELLGRGSTLSPSFTSRYQPEGGQRRKPTRKTARPERMARRGAGKQQHRV